MKALQFFESRSKQGKIALDDEFKKKLESMADFDIPDVWINLFDQEFLTRERALADPKIIDKLRAENLDAVDAIIKDIAPFLTDKDKADFQNETKTFNKLKLLKEAFPRQIEAIKAENPSSDDKVKELQKINKEYVERMAAQTADFTNKEKELKQAFESEKKGMKLDWTLDKKLGEYTFADEYKELRPTLQQSVIDKIKAGNVLILGEDGQISIHEKTESGVTKQKFINGNEPVTLEKLLEEPLKPFLKKNNAGNGSGQNGNGQNGSQGRQNPTPPAVKDRSQMTLKELSRAQMG